MTLDLEGLKLSDNFLTGTLTGLHRVFFPRWWRLKLWYRWMRTPVWLRARGTITFATPAGKPVAVSVLMFREPSALDARVLG